MELANLGKHFLLLEFDGLDFVLERSDLLVLHGGGEEGE